jgi:hypothetical protein
MAFPMFAGSAAGVIVGGEGAAYGAGATVGAGFVVAEPRFEAIDATLPQHRLRARVGCGLGESYSDMVLRPPRRRG